VKARDVLLELDPLLAQKQWQSAQASAKTARLAASDSKRRLAEARTLVPQRSIAESVVRDLEAEVAQDEADVLRAEAEEGFASGVLERHQLRAPFSGIVSEKNTELGEWVTPGQPVLTLVATQHLRMDFPVSEDYFADISLTTPVTYSLGDQDNTVRAGTISTIVPITDPGARTFLLRVTARKPDPNMLPGMSARALLTLGSGRKGLTVPRDAILKFPDGRAIVWIIEQQPDGVTTAKETRVTPGAVFDGMVEVRDGLSAGDQVVLEGNETLQNGQRITLLPPQTR
jgi:RND family efflux transporter MFP subunit